MPSPEYKSFTRRLKDNYAAIVATLALFVALGGTAVANSGLITGKQIRNGSISTADIHKGAVASKLIQPNAVTSAAIKADAVGSEELAPDAVTSEAIKPNAVGTSDINSGAVTSEQIGNGDVKSQDIGDGEVKPEDITEPAPQQFVIGSATAAVAGEFQKVTDVGTYSKQDPTSILSVTWTGTALAPRQACIFQIRVDGQPAANGAGLVFANSGEFQTVNVSSTALFVEGAGSHSVEVWARAITGGLPGTDPCVIGPAEAGIPQTFVVSEELT
jgi:hypothetical protein